MKISLLLKTVRILKIKRLWNVYGFSEAYGLWKESVLKESVLEKDKASHNDL